MHKKIRIYWNRHRDSIESDIYPDDYYRFKTVNIPNLAEGIYTFQLAIIDAAGHKSVFTQAVGRAYGTNYISRLANRAVPNIQTIGGVKQSIGFLKQMRRAL